MKRILLVLLLALGTNHSNAQSFTVDGSEIGVDLAFSASNFGGNVGVGLKYGVNLGEYIILGPSVRYERLWWKNYFAGTSQISSQGGRSVYGGGLFTHARFFNALFLGMEFEMLHSPYDKNGFLLVQGGSWAPTLFLGGGFSMEFNEIIRVNAGVMYDVINATNSPYRNSYSIKKQTSTGQVGGYLPIIYRLAFFFPIG